MKYFLLLLILSLSHITNATEGIKLCYENVIVFPWILGDEEGLALTEIKIVEKDLGIDFILIRKPWMRCQIEAQAGEIDGLIAASFTKERTEWGVYPTIQNGKLDRDKRMHTDSFYVYVRKDSKIDFKKNTFLNLGQNEIGVQLGYSVGHDLKEMGYSVHSSFTSAFDLLKQLNLKTLNVAILQNHETKRTLVQHPELSKQIKRINEPFKVKDQYVLFTKTFYAKNEATVKAIWKSIAKARQSKRYKTEEKKVLKRVNDASSS